MTKSTRREKALKNHIQRIEKRIKKLEVDKLRFSNYRPIIFIVGVASIYWVGWLPFAFSILLLSAESVYHKQFEKIIKKHQLWLNIKKTQIARMKLDWGKIPKQNNDSRDSNHPFENDLNITGDRSLHHLIDMSISREGSQRLTTWLLETSPDLNRIEKRQVIIRELVPFVRFRDKLLLNFHLISKGQLDGKKLLDWLQVKHRSNFLPRVFYISSGLALINIILFTCSSLGLITGYWILTLALYAGLYFFYLPLFNKDFDDIGLLDEELRKFRVVLKYIETCSFGKNLHLKKMCQPFLKHGSLPSVQLRNVTFLTTASGLRMNPMMTLILNSAFPWDLLCAFLIKRARTRFAKLIPEWLETWAKLEALVSIANFAYLNPEYIFPEFTTTENQTENNLPIFAVMLLGHPLIPTKQKVCNDFSVNKPGEVALLTGSNMAGKSTFLKTVGINLCLAYVGGPVNAANFRTILFRIFCSMQISDSIVDGISYFYAEVKRLKILMETFNKNQKQPVFWFVDEIYKGTNSRERLIGSRAYLNYLSKQPGIGLLATHDLELAGMSKQLLNLSNYHFRDDVKDGKMVFEFKLHSGPCPSTNALKIMQLEGLPIK